MNDKNQPKLPQIKSKQIQPQIGQPGWSNYIHPIDQSMPTHDFNCQCTMCAKYQYKKFNEALNQQTKTINNKIRRRIIQNQSQRQQLLDNNYHWVIKHLMIPQHKIATNGLNIYITESLFFKDGEPSELFLTKDIEQPIIKRVPKQKLNSTYIQKAFTDRRRKYKEYIRTKTGRNKPQQKKRLFILQKQTRKQIKDAVTIRYIDGYEQLISQNQFMLLFLRRRQDPIWKQIVSIRNFLNVTNPQEQGSKYVVVKFKREKIKYEQLYERAKLLMKVYGKYISEGQRGYISHSQQAQFKKTIKKNDIAIYAEYCVYQIVNFIEYFYDEEINTIVIGIYFDQIGNLFINEVYKLDTKSLIKFQWTHEIYKKRMDFQQTKVFLSKPLTYDIPLGNSTNILVRAMHNAYERMRDVFGLTAQEEDDKQQVANNNFFKSMHPQFNHNISEILKDPNLNVSEFKRVYLGFKEKKKPIVKEFTSNMIRTIHEGSPRFKRLAPSNQSESPRRHNSLFVTQTSPRTQRKRHSVIASPVKKNLHFKLYDTLPIK